MRRSISIRESHIVMIAMILHVDDVIAASKSKGGGLPGDPGGYGRGGTGPGSYDDPDIRSYELAYLCK
jgi:hypothetical protein